MTTLPRFHAAPEAGHLMLERDGEMAAIDAAMSRAAAGAGMAAR